MHIAFLILNLGSGGAERSVSALSSRMAECGHTVTVLALTGTESFYAFSDAVNVRYLNMPELPRGRQRAFAVLRRAKALRKAVKTLHPDILVGMSHIMSAYAVFCTVGTSVRAVGTERANPFLLYANPAMTLLRRTAAFFCDGFVCQTKKARSFFPKSVQKKAAVIPNAVFNPTVFETTVPAVRQKNITALGRLDHNKGFDLLLRAFSVVHQAFPDYTLTIFGEGEKRGELLELAEELHIGQAVRLPGVSRDAIHTIAESSAFVLSSRSEGMPNALLEAMAAGVPCVASRCDMGPEELIEDGVNGLLVPVENADAITDALCRILHSPELSASLSTNALHIRTTHGIAEITDRWLAYFGTVINNL